MKLCSTKSLTDMATSNKMSSLEFLMFSEQKIINVIGDNHIASYI